MTIDTLLTYIIYIWMSFTEYDNVRSCTECFVSMSPVSLVLYIQVIQPTCSLFRVDMDFITRNLAQDRLQVTTNNPLEIYHRKYSNSSIVFFYLF